MIPDPEICGFPGIDLGIGFPPRRIMISPRTDSLLAAVFSCALTLSAHSQETIPAEQFLLPEDLEISVWAKSPLFYNPANIDIDARGRIWVAEAVNYRGFKDHRKDSRWHPEGDRIVILEDTTNDGRADSSTVFVQDEDLVAPLGVAVMGNRILVSCSPHLLLYTDVDNNSRFDPAIDKKEKFLTGFGGLDHDHSLHSVLAGPDGWWYFNAGNAGPHIVTDKSGWTLRSSSFYGSPRSDIKNVPGLKSDDGRVYVGGLALRIRPDGTGLSVLAHNFRNSYEITLDSHGNVFQNDNDDQVVTCRTTWLMEHANTGYASADGKRSWRADQRPGQSTSAAHWHQDDPGVVPYGDLYGAGSPTGMLFYEGDLLEGYRGMLVNCEAGRNVLWGYHPEVSGAGFALERFPLLTSYPVDDPDYKWKTREKDVRKWFRPSDAATGPDGAIYVADWFDPVVGGHAMDDRKGSGTIYRIAPKGTGRKKLPIPAHDLSTTQGCIAALKSPAPNVRFPAFEKLRQQGDSAVPAVEALLTDPNPYIQSRAIFLLAQLGVQGREVVTGLLKAPAAEHRLVALRALQRAGLPILAHATSLAADSSPAVRRELALAMRDVPLDQSEEILLKLAEGFDGEDRWYLEALGTGCEGKEDELYPAILGRLGARPLDWTPSFAALVWRLHPRHALTPLALRAKSTGLDHETRKQAVDTIAFTVDQRAADLMEDLAANGPEDLRDYANWWLQFRANNLWQDFDVQPLASQEPAAGPGITLPTDAGDQGEGTGQDQPTIQDITKLTGDPGRGRKLFHERATCVTCHVYAGKGGSLGPDLTTIGAKFDAPALLDSLLNPSASITFGYELTVVTLKSGEVVTGFVQGTGDPLLVADVVTGRQRAIKASDTASTEQMKTSLMPSATSLGLKNQDLADLVAFLLTNPQSGQSTPDPDGGDDPGRN